MIQKMILVEFEKEMRKIKLNQKKIPKKKRMDVVIRNQYLNIY